MKRQLRSLDSLFEAARREESPVSADDVRAILHQSPNSALIPRGSTMFTTLLAASVALAAIVGTNVLIIHDTPQTPPPGKITATVPKTSTSTTAITTSDKPSIGTTTASTVSTNGTTPVAVTRPRSSGNQRTTSNVAFVSSAPIAACALRADETILNSLNINLPGLRKLGNIAASDSVVACSPNPRQLTVCLFKDGKPQEVDIAAGDSPRPYMVTSPSGAGRIIRFASNSTESVDPNSLIPVTAPTSAENVIMWYPASEKFVRAFPDSLATALEETIVIHIDDNGNHVNVSTSRNGQKNVRVFNTDSLPKLDALGSVDILREFKNHSAKELMGLDANELADFYRKHTKQLGVSADSLRAYVRNLYTQNRLPIFSDSLLELREINIDSLKVMSEVVTKFFDSNASTFNSFSFDSLNALNFRFDSTFLRMFNNPIWLKMVDTLTNGPCMKFDSTKVIKRRTYDAQDHSLIREEDVTVSIAITPDEQTSSAADSNLRSIKRQVIIRSVPSRTVLSNRIMIITSGKGQKGQQLPTSTDGVTGLQELHRSSNGAITSTDIYPNPVTDGAATLAFTLSEDRTLSVSLHDLSGTKVADILQQQRRTAGPGQFAFPITGVSPGMYLVSLTTEKGERTVRRLIVE